MCLTLLNNISLDFDYHPSSNLPFLEQVIEWVVAQKFQVYLSDSWNPVSLAFILVIIKIAHMSLIYELCLKIDSENFILLVLLDLYTLITGGHRITHLHDLLGILRVILNWFYSFLTGRS